jgi:hypothetical protein
MLKIRCFLPVIFLFISCNEKHIGSDQGCISQIKRHYIAGADSLAAIKLLKQNNIPCKDLKFDKIILNDTIINNGKTCIYQDVFVIRSFNGLPVLLQAIVYHFKEGAYQFASGPGNKEISLDANAELTLPQVRKLYLDELNSKSNSASSFKDSCLVAEFGYYNLNEGTEKTSSNFVKAWVVTPKNANYPEALLRDDNGKTIFYFNGREIAD